MKTLSKLLNRISGLYRLLITILFFLAMVFSLFVDKDLLTSFYDLLGFDSITAAIIKPITFILFACAFLINSVVTKRIFSSNKNGKHHLSNLFFAFLFTLISVGLLLYIRDNLFLISIILNVLLILGSIFGLIAKAKGAYNKEELLVSENKLNEDEDKVHESDPISNENEADEEVSSQEIKENPSNNLEEIENENQPSDDKKEMNQEEANFDENTESKDQIYSIEDDEETSLEEDSLTNLEGDFEKTSSETNNTAEVYSSDYLQKTKNQIKENIDSNEKE